MLLYSLSTQLRVIHALFMREMITHFGRHGLGFLWMFGEPIMFTLGVLALFSFTGHEYGGLSPQGFILTGYSGLVAWRNCVGRAANAIKSNQGLLYHRIVTIFDITLARLIFEFIAVSFSFLILTLIFYWIGIHPLPKNPAQVIVAWILLGWFAFNVGFIASFLDHRSKFFEKFWHVMVYLALPFTGAFSMVSWLPPKMREILLYSPMVNAMEYLREGYLGGGIQAIYSLSYIFFCNITLSFFALLLICQVKKYIGRE